MAQLLRSGPLANMSQQATSVDGFNFWDILTGVANRAKPSLTAMHTWGSVFERNADDTALFSAMLIARERWLTEPSISVKTFEPSAHMQWEHHLPANLGAIQQVQTIVLLGTNTQSDSWQSQ